MTENLSVTSGASKQETYEEILPQIESIIAGEEDYIANLANICAILNTAFGHLWTGFYIRKDDVLILGPFQGPLACTRIPLKPVARGVCGVAALNKETIIVPNVDEFIGHIACNSASKSEIVIPLIKDGETKLILDIDSEHLDSFNKIDALYLGKLIELIKKQHFS